MAPLPSDKASTAPDRRQWFVRMSNGSTFGPIHTRGLLLWAQEGRIMPDDEVSEDRKTWAPAQDVEELGMDTLIERPDGTFSGPFHPNAIQPLAAEGKIPPNARTFHRDELPAMLAARQLALFPEPDVPAEPEDAACEATFVKAPKSRDRDRNRERETELNAERELNREKDREKDSALAALQQENQRMTERITELEDALTAGRRTSEGARKQTEKLQGQFEALRAQLASTSEALADAELRASEGEKLALMHRQKAEEAQTELHALKERVERLEADLAQSKTDYSELLEFSNTRDTEYTLRLEAAEEVAGAAQAAETDPEAPILSGDSRRIRQLEEQVTNARRELEEQRQHLETAQAEAARAARPQEPEIARIQTFAETALAALQQTLEQEKEINEQARAASASRQEALRSQLEQLQRALNLAPGEPSRTEQMERRNDRLIAKLKQELEASRRQHQAELHQAAERQRELEQRSLAMEKREAAARDQLSRAGRRSEEYDSLESQLRRREGALLAVERDFETARQQWQAIETALMHRIEELESGASRLLSDSDSHTNASPRASAFQAKPWMKLHR